MKGFISNPSQLLEDVWSDRDVSIVQKTHTLSNRKFTLMDMWVNSNGVEEERKYLRSSFYRTNMRIGGTIIENAKNNYCQFAHRGTPITFDLRLQHIHYFQHGLNIDKSDRTLAQIIFQDLNQDLRYANKIELLKQDKHSGQLFHISYNYEYDAWIIALPQVALLAASIEDLIVYRESRYESVVVVAQHWFELIKGFNKDKIKELKKVLDGFTAVGELCGHPHFHQTIHYESVQVKWYTLIDHYSQDFCVDPSSATVEFAKFGFQQAQVKGIMLTSSSETFYSALEKLYLKTAEASIEDTIFGMEGCIVYFNSTQPGKQKQRTIGAVRIKTIEFRFYTQIKECAVRNLQIKNMSEKIMLKFKQELQQTETYYSGKAPFPHEYYCKILETLLELSESLALKEKQVNQNFTKYLKMIFYCIFKRISVKKHGKSMVEDDIFMGRVSEIQLSKYGGLGCKIKIIYIVVGLPGMFKSFLGDKIATHFQKINVPYEIVPLQKKQNIESDLKCVCKPQLNPLEHYYLDGSFDYEYIFEIIKCIKKNRDGNSFHKFILIKDQHEVPFTCSDKNKYPFCLSTIIMCYYGQHQQKINSPRIQDKIDNLKLVTNRLRNLANFQEVSSRLGLEEYHYPFSRECKLTNMQQIGKIIMEILRGNLSEKNEFNSYGILILRLEHCQGICYMRQDQINTQIQHLIKASYPSIPMISFKK